MPKPNQKILEILKKKLSYGSTRSILINCIPGRMASRLALNDLNVIKEGMGTCFELNSYSPKYQSSPKTTPPMFSRVLRNELWCKLWCK